MFPSNGRWGPKRKTNRKSEHPKKKKKKKWLVPPALNNRSFITSAPRALIIKWIPQWCFCPIHVGNQGRQDKACPELEGIYGIADLVPISESNSYTQYRKCILVLRVEEDNKVIGQVAVRTCGWFAQAHSRQAFESCWIDFEVVVVQSWL